MVKGVISAASCGYRASYYSITRDAFPVLASLSKLDRFVETSYIPEFVLNMHLLRFRLNSLSSTLSSM